MTELDAIEQRYERLHPDLEIVKEIMYLVARVKAAEVLLALWFAKGDSGGPEEARALAAWERYSKGMQ